MSSALRQHPGKRQLSRRTTLSCRKRLDPLNQFHIPTEILLLEAGHAAAPIIVGKIVEVGDFGSQEAAAERTIGDETDPKLAHRLE